MHTYSYSNVRHTKFWLCTLFHIEPWKNNITAIDLTVPILNTSASGGKLANIAQSHVVQITMVILCEMHGSLLCELYIIKIMFIKCFWGFLQNNTHQLLHPRRSNSTYYQLSKFELRYIKIQELKDVIIVSKPEEVRDIQSETLGKLKHWTLRSL